MICTELAFLGVSQAKAKQFATKGINTVEDLVRFLPNKYYDFRTPCVPSADDDIACAIMHVLKIKTGSGKINYVTAFGTIKNSTEKLSVTWFNQKYLHRKLDAYVGHDVLVGGKFTYNSEYKSFSVCNPIVFSADIEREMRMYPRYPKINKMSEQYLVDCLKKALDYADVSKETVPFEYLEQHNLMYTKNMLNTLHFPTSELELQKAKERLIFDDLLYFSIKLQYAARQVSKGSQYNLKTMAKTLSIIKSLPYTLTADQKIAFDRATNLMRDGRRVNALLQGDVGCGKTIVAFLLMMAMVDSGYQVALMAPTQVLAQQHYDDFVSLTKNLDIDVVLFDSTQKTKKQTLEKIKTGETSVVIGTHSILNKKIEFKNLALTITDEEHKFGVAQRQALVEKAGNGVHTLTMSATPIPRSLATVLYGDDIDVYTIKSMPSCRKTVKTGITSNMKATFDFLEKEINQGRQAYVVCPLIEDSQALQGLTSVNTIAENYKNHFASRGINVDVLTGRNSKEEMDTIINNFKQNNTQILISTTVIEVGVNVPNASVIVIHNAERFGLSTLHQLRGRVGRGSHQSYCLLLSEDKNNERLNVMVANTDGFKIAEEDLRIRGAGDFIGTQQSGDNKYVSLMLLYPELYSKAKAVAGQLLNTQEPCLIMEQALAEA